jgi:hypothetical protein
VWPIDSYCFVLGVGLYFLNLYGLNHSYQRAILKQLQRIAVLSIIDSSHLQSFELSIWYNKRLMDDNNGGLL